MKQMPKGMPMKSMPKDWPKDMNCVGGIKNGKSGK